MLLYFLMERKNFLMLLEVEYFQKENKENNLAKVFDCNAFNHKQFKILTPNQMLQRLPVALAQVKAGNTSEHLLNEILEIIYSLYRVTEFTKKVYNNIMNSISYKIECILYL